MKSCKLWPPIAILEDEKLNKLKQFSSGRAPVLGHPSLYSALKLTYPWGIGGISSDVTIKTEMGQESIEAVDVLTLTMFKPDTHPNLIPDNGSLVGEFECLGPEIGVL